MTDLLQEHLLPLLHQAERPVAWGMFHSLFFFIGIPIAIIIAFLLRRISLRSENHLLRTIGILLIIAEIFKQCAFTAIEGAYPCDLIPFQLCSIPMYLCIIISYLPKGKMRCAARTFLATFGLMGGVASYIAPGTMCRDWLELTLHSFLWHLILILLGFFIFFSKNTEGLDFVGAEMLYLGLCAIALSINLVFINAPTDVNMFYIGPKPSSLPICREITKELGVFFNSLVYISSLSLCAFLIYLFERAISSRIKKK